MSIQPKLGRSQEARTMADESRDQAHDALPPPHPRARASQAVDRDREGRGPHQRQHARPRSTRHEHRDVLLARRRILPREHLRDGVRERAGPARRELLGLRPGGEAVPHHLLQQQRTLHRGRQSLRGKIAGNKLTFEGPARFQYDLDDAREVKVNPDGTISVAWWLRDEHGHWQPWMENTFTRLRD
jgi:hypothetical protein